MKKLEILALLICILLLFSGPANALPTIAYFSGTITEIQEWNPEYLPQGIRDIDVGDPFWGLFWYEFDNPPQPQANTFSHYESSDISFGYSLNFDTINFYAGHRSDVIIGDTPEGSTDNDFFVICDGHPGPAFPNTGYFIDDILINLSGNNSSFNSYEMPDNLNSFIFDHGNIWIEGYFGSPIGNDPPDGTARSFGGTIDHFQVAAPVPEPATMLLLGTGLVGLVGFGRRKFKK